MQTLASPLSIVTNILVSFSSISILTKIPTTPCLYKHRDECHGPGRGTIIYLAEREGKQYIIKDHWVENPQQEAVMMTHMKGIRGIPQLVDSWVVEIRPGVADVTSRYRSEERRVSMKAIRTHVRKVMSPRGRPLIKFRTKRELVQCIRDILVGEYTLHSALLKFYG